jgi:hypothetical protein
MTTGDSEVELLPNRKGGVGRFNLCSAKLEAILNAGIPRTPGLSSHLAENTHLPSAIGKNSDLVSSAQ